MSRKMARKSLFKLSLELFKTIECSLSVSVRQLVFPFSLYSNASNFSISKAAKHGRNLGPRAEKGYPSSRKSY